MLFAHFPLPGIAKAYLLEARIVNPVGSRDVKVTADNDLGIVLGVPILSLLGTTP